MKRWERQRGRDGEENEKANNWNKAKETGTGTGNEAVGDTDKSLM
jgi:hypothetical protein